MNLIKQSFEVLTPVCKRVYYSDIEDAARSCYQSEGKNSGKNPQITEDFVARLVRARHLSTIEHKSITVRFVTNRGVTHELVRHRLASYSQESTRYCNYDGCILYIQPVWVDDDVGQEDVEPVEMFIDGLIASERLYENLLKKGWTPQKAREVLPNALKTDIVVTANLRQWLTILQQRTTKAAHPQIRHLMCGLYRKFAELLPVIFNGNTVPNVDARMLAQVEESNYYES